MCCGKCNYWYCEKCLLKEEKKDVLEAKCNDFQKFNKHDYRKIKKGLLVL